MRLSSRCKKCGSDCTPRWQRASDTMRYDCVCGYGWNSQPLDARPDRSGDFLEFAKRMRDAQRKCDMELYKDPPLKVWLTNGTGRGEINLASS